MLRAPCSVFAAYPELCSPSRVTPPWRSRRFRPAPQRPIAVASTFRGAPTAGWFSTRILEGHRDFQANQHIELDPVERCLVFAWAWWCNGRPWFYVLALASGWTWIADMAAEHFQHMEFRLQSWQPNVLRILYFASRVWFRGVESGVEDLTERRRSERALEMLHRSMCNVVMPNTTRMHSFL